MNPIQTAGTILEMINTSSEMLNEIALLGRNVTSIQREHWEESLTKRNAIKVKNLDSELEILDLELKAKLDKRKKKLEKKNKNKNKD